MRSNNRVLRLMAVLLAAVLMILSFSGCAEETIITNTDDLPIDYNMSKIIYFEIEFTDGDVMSGELYPYLAPLTVSNFVTLAQAGYYDGAEFYRIDADLFVQADNLEENENPEYTIMGEFSSNGWNNTIRHDRGTISMGRGSDYDSAYGSFFIMLDTELSFNGKYAAFGKITKNLWKLDEIAATQVDSNQEAVGDMYTIQTVRILGN